MGPHFMLLLSIYVLYSNVTYIYPVSCVVEIKLFRLYIMQLYKIYMINYQETYLVEKYKWQFCVITTDACPSLILFLKTMTNTCKLHAALSHVPHSVTCRTQPRAALSHTPHSAKRRSQPYTALSHTPHSATCHTQPHRTQPHTALSHMPHSATQHSATRHNSIHYFIALKYFAYPKYSWSLWSLLYLLSVKSSLSIWYCEDLIYIFEMIYTS